MRTTRVLLTNAAVLAGAQEFRALLSGAIVASSGATLPNASVSIVNVATRTPSSTSSRSGVTLDHVFTVNIRTVIDIRMAWDGFLAYLYQITADSVNGSRLRFHGLPGSFPLPRFPSLTFTNDLPTGNTDDNYLPIAERYSATESGAAGWQTNLQSLVRYVYQTDERDAFRLLVHGRTGHVACNWHGTNSEPRRAISPTFAMTGNQSSTCRSSKSFQSGSA
jgi:hypothetical protein